MEKDPGEVNNLMDTANLPRADYERLRRKCLEMERLYGDPEYVRNGTFTDAPAGQFPHFMCAKFPAFANAQFQRFGEASADVEARRVVEETRQAVAHHGDPDYLRKIHNDTEWIERWEKGVRRVGGTEKERKEIFGE